MSQQNIEVVRRSIEAYNRRDFETLGVLNQPDIEVDWSASQGFQAGVYRGWEEVRGSTKLPRNIRGGHAGTRRLHRVRRFGRRSQLGRDRGRDGIEAAAHSALVFELRDGRIGRICLYQETGEAFEAAGVGSRRCRKRTWTS